MRSYFVEAIMFVIVRAFDRNSFMTGGTTKKWSPVLPLNRSIISSILAMIGSILLAGLARHPVALESESSYCV